MGGEKPKVGTWLEADHKYLARWLIEQGLGPLAYARLKDAWPALAQELQGDAFLAKAEHALHIEQLTQIAQSFAKSGIPVVPVKGAALSQSVYDDASWRPMSDIDIWVPEPYMPRAAQAMRDLGYSTTTNQERPFSLHRFLDGEVQFSAPNKGLIELHRSPFSSWWLHRVGAVEEEAIWSRLEPIECPVHVASSQRGGNPESVNGAYQMAPEDTIVHLAFHLAVKHKVGMWPLRSLVDIAFVATRREVNWQAVAQRAREWRLASVVWLVLDLTDQLIRLGETQVALERLHPWRVRRALLHHVVLPETLLSGVDLRERQARFLLLLLLVDRPRDALRLVFRTLLPEREWMEARYPQGDVNRWQHLWRVVRHGQI